MTSAMEGMASTYSEASQAFLTRDWGRAGSLVDTLLARLEGGGRASTAANGSSNGSAVKDEEDEELVRKVWILKITLLASSLAPGTSPSCEAALSDWYNRVKAYYASRASTSYHIDVLHPALLVALSLAGLKLHAPFLSRRVLEDYFDALLYADVHGTAVVDASGLGLPTTNGPLDESSADLSLSGIAVPSAEQQPPISVNGSTAPAIAPVTAGWSKSLHRLARIYAVHLLGKTLGEWDEARIWIDAQRHEEAGIQLVTEENAQSLFDELKMTKVQQERELQALRDIEKQRSEQARQAVNSRARNGSKGGAISYPSKSINGTLALADNPKSELGDRTASPPSSSEGEDRAGRSKREGSKRNSKRSDAGYDRAATDRPKQALQRHTSSFAGLRSHISSFLSSSRERSSPSMAVTPSSSSTLESFYAVLRRLSASRLFNTMLVFLLLVTAWRRRLTRSGRSARAETTRYWSLVKDKVLQTIKMGGSLGYL